MEKFLIFVALYLIIINAFAVGITVFDKLRAIRHGWRVSEVTLLTVAALGGSPAMLITMIMIHHKIRKPKFMVGIPLILAAQIAAVILLWRVFHA